eukprot:gnl/TRDRNA2_/TRDRNA2_150810_c2_seq4.p1 gnl/TRDRNA2_/TRDRNA2_150810_c2~~gnl/TRDRNA2_/TRDRNA2_150810_c2_seq4.p1  ORF type:complete len:140 (+),score=20.17 gnl/TRDRNA2_/TRDRNA2_150810_c2_seq4:2-421(+)
MVDVLAEMGRQTGVSSFYISFVLAPLASNASELVAAYNYATKKTRDSITISLNTLEGAACMNNTFCLGIFYLLVAARGIAWHFHAEVISILFVEVAMTVVAFKKTHRVFDGFLVLGLMPLCLIMVYILKATVFHKYEPS